MKIMYFIDSNPENGGAPISTCSIADKVSTLNNSISIVYPEQAKKYVHFSNVKVIEIIGFKDTFPSLVLNTSKAVKLMSEFRKPIKLINPDVIHAQMPRSAWLIGILKILRQLPKKTRLIYTDRDHLQSYRLPIRIICRLLIKLQFDKIICLTEISAEYWGKHHIGASTHCIPNYAGSHYETYNEEKHLDMRKRHGICDDELTIMFSGRMSVYKNWGLAKDIVMNLKGLKIKFIFAISTMSKEQENDYEGFVDSLLSLSDDIILFRNLTQSEISECYYMADVFILTSDRESFGRTAIEAMSRKCCVLGRAVGGLPEVIGKTENILGPNVNEFADRVKFYNNNSEVLLDDKIWFKDRFDTLYTESSSIKSHMDIYNEDNL